MALSITPLLLHGDAVPAEARTALRAAYDAPAGERDAHLEAAARVLFRQAELDCADVRELVGLVPAADC